MKQTARIWTKLNHIVAFQIRLSVVCLICTTAYPGWRELSRDLGPDRTMVCQPKCPSLTMALFLSLSFPLLSLSCVSLSLSISSPLSSLSSLSPSSSSPAPSRPSFLHFSELTTTSVNVSWGEPTYPNGILEGYRLVYEPCTPVDGKTPTSSCPTSHI